MDDATPGDLVQEMARECLAVRMRTLNRAVTALYDEALRPLGVRVGQMNLLTAIARLGTARPGDLCRILQMDKSTLSRDLEVMRRNGWVEVDDSAGVRGKPLRATAQGLDLIRAVRPAWQTAQDKTRALLGEQGAATIVRAVDGLWREARTGG